ncbi:hypothetical protein FB451DRAFT_1168742 [Mycena latifolia]|nr:hypothetical protein FB451DRAFT_1168742 [Mycena latifolia]
MPTKSPSIDPNLSVSEVKAFIASALDVAHSFSGAQLSAAQMAARREAADRYRWKNEGDLRVKARIRMRAHRQAVKDTQALHEDYCSKKLHADTAYHKKHSKMLAFKQRIRRQNAFIEKHGQQAFSDRIARQQAAEDAAWYRKAAEERAALEAKAAARREAREKGIREEAEAEAHASRT